MVDVVLVGLKGLHPCYISKLNQINAENIKVLFGKALVKENALEKEEFAQVCRIILQFF